MISLVRAGTSFGTGDGWDKLIAAVEEALRLGISDAAAVLHLLRMPDPEQRRQHAALAEELLQFERPMPVMDNYDLLLANTTGAIEPDASLGICQRASSAAKRSDCPPWAPTSCPWPSRQ